MNAYEQEFENEAKQFLFLCGKRDRDIILSEDADGKIDEFARLACISLIFDFRKMFLKIVACTEKYSDKLFAKFNSVTYQELNAWMSNFIENVENPKARKLVEEVWQEKKAKLDRKDFTVRQILE